MAADRILTGEPAVEQPQSPERIQGAPVRHRRSGRIARRLEVTVRWELGGSPQETPAETKMLSRYGCLMAGHCRPKLGEEISLVWPEKQRETKARVVFRALNGASESVQLAVEFLGADDFWQIDFPPSFMSIMD
ncbi:MAG: hypothetical protein L0099_08050 [Acidobacteria bacterium]|nr:hypothetical protein [Acidobacteriota bacterium]